MNDARLVQVCLKSSYFTFKNECYEQIEGVPNGSPLSPIVVNLYIEKFEKPAMDSFPGNLKEGSATWTTRILFGLMDLDRFFNHLNNLNNNQDHIEQEIANLFQLLTFVKYSK